MPTQPMTDELFLMLQDANEYDSESAGSVIERDSSGAHENLRVDSYRGLSGK